MIMVLDSKQRSSQSLFNCFQMQLIFNLTSEFVIELATFTFLLLTTPFRHPPWHFCDSIVHFDPQTSQCGLIHSDTSISPLHIFHFQRSRPIQEVGVLQNYQRFLFSRVSCWVLLYLSSVA